MALSGSVPCRPIFDIMAGVERQIRSIEFPGELIFLGTGTSVGVPAIGCACATCTSANPRNKRTRCSVALGLPEGNLLIDTTPDMRLQLLREGIGVIHSVLYTHEHADHLFGLDDVRLFPFYLGHPLPVYCEEHVERRIRHSFDYAFSDHPIHAGGVPSVDIRRVTTEEFDILGARCTPLRLLHGRFDVLGFRFGNVAYCTDTSAIPEASMEKLQGLDVLILDALRDRPHPTHLALEESVALAEKLRPKQTYFTHMCHELEHEATSAQLPSGMELAYDGLRVPLT